LAPSCTCFSPPKICANAACKQTYVGVVADMVQVLMEGAMYQGKALAHLGGLHKTKCWMVPKANEAGDCPVLKRGSYIKSVSGRVYKV
jgi:hypothetical protein